jgi:hypothetical protein
MTYGVRNAAALFALLSFGLVSLSVHQVSAAEITAIDRSEIDSAIQRSGRARILIFIAPNALRPTLASPDEVYDTARRVLRRVLGYLGDLPGPSTSRLRPVLYPAAGYLAVSVTRRELDALARDPNVIAIHHNRAVPFSSGERGGISQGHRPNAANWNSWHNLIRTSDLELTKSFGDGAVVVVLDTGMNSRLAYFKDVVVGEACFSRNEGSFRTTCTNGKTNDQGIDIAIGEGAAMPRRVEKNSSHGTHVASIISGKSLAGYPKNGIAAHAKLFPINFMSQKGARLTWEYEALIAAFQELRDAVTKPSHPYHSVFKDKVVIVNMSFEDPEVKGSVSEKNCTSKFPLLDAGITQASQQLGWFFVGAAGNGAEQELSTWPSCLRYVIEVGATTMQDARQRLSNNARFWAPGEDILGLDIDGLPLYLTGTSQAAPQVAAMLAAGSGKWKALILNELFPVNLQFGGMRLSPTYALSKHVNRNLIANNRSEDHVFGNGCTIVRYRNDRDRCIRQLYCEPGKIFDLVASRAKVQYRLAVKESSGSPVTPYLSHSGAVGDAIEVRPNRSDLLSMGASQTFDGAFDIQNRTVLQQKPFRVRYQMKLSYVDNC